MTTAMGPIRLRGYYPGAVGRITALHAEYYHRHWGLDASFECQVGRELSDFVAAFDPGRDGLWIAEFDGGFAGAAAIDGRDAAGEGARLRWFIVLPELQGRGIGSELLARAIAFCRERGYPKLFLWTFRGLDTARRAYEKNGFRLKTEHDVAQWGQRICGQKFELDLGG